MSPPRSRPRVILTGTDPLDETGGVAAAVGAYARALESGGILDRVIPSHRSVGASGRLVTPLVASVVLRSYLRHRDVVRVPTVIYGHGGGWLGMARQAAVLSAGRQRGVKTVLHAHSASLAGDLRSRWRRPLTAAVLGSVDGVAVVAEHWAKMLREDLGLDNVHVVPNSLSEELEQRATDGGVHPVGLGGGPTKILCLTRVVAGKGVPLLIRSMSLLPSTFQLTVAGDGPELASSIQLAHDLDLGGRVHFTGWVSGTAKTRLLEEAHIFSLPTRYDSFGMGFLEAMAYGKPIVAVDWGPIPEVVANGEVGHLAKGFEPSSVAEELLRLEDPMERQQLGDRARRYVVARFGQEATLKRLETMFESLFHD